jgi:outer membrane protein
MNLSETFEQQRNALMADVRVAHLDFTKSSLQLEVAQLAERSAEEDVRLQEERYRLGASSILELLDAQVSLTNAQYSRVLALFELNRSSASLARSLGYR